MTLSEDETAIKEVTGILITLLAGCVERDPHMKKQFDEVTARMVSLGMTGRQMQ